MPRPNDPPLTAKFAKDQRREEMLTRMNQALEPLQMAEEIPDQEPFPTLHVVGSPRSGTTLLFQVIASGLEVSYVNNLAATFWDAPSFGMMLSRSLGVDRLASDFSSDFGRTKGVTEPHEFGYFWNARLGYPDLAEQDSDHDARIDWTRLRRDIIAMAMQAGAPVVFKPMLLVWHLESMVRHMPGTCYVWIRRAPRDTALSLLKMRMSLFGNLETWASLRPRVPDVSMEPPWRQVAAQVVTLERLLENAYARLGDQHMLPVRYERLCSDPMGVVNDVRDLMGGKGFAPELRVDRMEPFREMRNSDLEEKYGDLIDEALEHYLSAGDSQ